MLARGPIGPVAGAERDLAQAEVVAEVLPLGVAGFAVFLAGTVSSALVNELPVVADHLLGIDGDVCLSGVEIEVAKELRGDVDRQAAVDRLGREDSPDRRQGIGTLLLDEVRRHSPGGVSLHVFEQNTDARAFYERHGSTVLDTSDGRRNMENLPDLTLRWTQNSAR
ncbi:MULTISPECIES: GNAT family N-acetyltransferase [Streptomyces]|uniref:GNAT family N-acetyltransferase n=1 Tax=Streptomyces TaxID=1883 RepID=UPI000BD02A54|nr:GNAT family N-acetyltransferase [Streptomyces sp. OK228]SOE25038.1 Acetyltransferase (GNAT) family protein [Streptomyces sp. OK228]